MTSSANGEPRCDAPSGVPVTTTRSSTLARRVSDATSTPLDDRDGASTICVAPITMGRNVVPLSNVSSTAPIEIRSIATHTRRSRGNSSALYDNSTCASVATLSNAWRSETSVSLALTMRSSGAAHDEPRSIDAPRTVQPTSTAAALARASACAACAATAGALCAAASRGNANAADTINAVIAPATRYRRTAPIACMRLRESCFVQPFAK